MGASYRYKDHEDGKATMFIEYTSADVTGEISFPTRAALDAAQEDRACAGGRRHWSPEQWREWAENHGGHVEWIKGGYQ
jgi:hypothetical protein